MYENNRNCCQNTGDCSCHICSILVGVFGTTPHCRGCREINTELLDEMTKDIGVMIKALRESIIVVEFEDAPIPETSDESGDDPVTKP